MINWSNVAEANRPAYYEWHSREHMAGRVAIPGFQRGRRFIAARARRDFLMLYEVDSLAVLTGPEYLAKANNPSPLTQSTTKLIGNSVRALAKVQLSLGIGQGGQASRSKRSIAPAMRNSRRRRCEARRAAACAFSPQGKMTRL